MVIPWSSFHVRLHRVLRSRPLIPKHQRVLVAVSGGQDSLCLIRLLLDLQPKWGWELAIAHCNHGWRSDADANADYVEQLAQTWTLPYHGLNISSYADGTRENNQTDPPPSYDSAPPATTEAEARAWRYHVLKETALAYQYAVICTGHTASDRAETLLYNLMRGSGTDGLQALSWQRPLVISAESGSMPSATVQLVRPLLGMTRSDTGQVCQEYGLQPWLDTTNDNWRYARNRIRQDVLPYLQTHFNPNVEHHLAQTAEILQAEVAYLNAETERLWQQVIDEQIRDEQIKNEPIDEQIELVPAPDADNCPTLPLRLHRRTLFNAPLALQRRVIRRYLLALLPSAPNFDHIEKLLALVTAPHRSQTDPFPGGAIARVDHDWIVFIATQPSTFHSLSK